MRGRAAFGVLMMVAIAAAFGGCDEAPLTTYFEPEQRPAAPAVLGTVFDAASAGGIVGRITWKGNLPHVEPFLAPVSPLSEQPNGPKLLWRNPHTPCIDSRTNGVAGAVVFLRGIDPARAHPRDLPPVQVDVHSCQLHVHQGDVDAMTGFVHRGDTVSIVSNDERFQAVRARGSAFFTLTLPDRGHAHERRLQDSGVVELSSNAGQFWMRAYLFVSDHPYFARTDSQGAYTLDRVPPGNYELACWLPDWHVASHELDAETALITRVTFSPSVVKLRNVTVKPHGSEAADMTFSLDDFSKSAAPGNADLR
jgi:hypothetical protein